MTKTEEDKKCKNPKGSEQRLTYIQMSQRCCRDSKRKSNDLLSHEKLKLKEKTQKLLKIPKNKKENMKVYKESEKLFKAYKATKY